MRYVYDDGLMNYFFVVAVVNFSLLLYLCGVVDGELYDFLAPEKHINLPAATRHTPIQLEIFNLF